MAAEPLDSDTGPRRVAPVLLVAAGGAAGTALRAAVGLAIPDRGGIPLAIVCVNLAGAFALGLLLAVLAELGPEGRVRLYLRLLLGTGLLGGFTTYSTLALGTTALVDDDGASMLLAACYGIGSVVLGVAAAGLGATLGARLGRGAGRSS